MWSALERRALTAYSTAEEYNRVLVRLAVLARYFKLWDWQASYGGAGDPVEEYCEWFEALPLVRAALPQTEAKDQEHTTETVHHGELLARMIWRENDAVFEAVIGSYGECAEIELAHDLRQAAGIGDDFGSHVTFPDEFQSFAPSVQAQEAFFNENGLSMREFDCLSIISNRFTV
ncbi:MAG: hypothetical protein HYY24_07585 [Verrucomicrobia bacterium]|nr:hypothetical protein [Verrucomicrobiota bacterium]